jgi:hypothetical protein
MHDGRKVVVELADDVVDGTAAALRPGLGWAGALAGWVFGSAAGALATAGALVAAPAGLRPHLLGPAGAHLLVGFGWAGAVLGAQAGCLRVGFRMLVTCIVGGAIAGGLVVVLADEHPAVAAHFRGLGTISAFPAEGLLVASWAGTLTGALAGVVLGAGVLAPGTTAVASLAGTLFAAWALRERADAAAAVAYAGLVVALFSGGGAQVGIGIRRALE